MGTATFRAVRGATLLLILATGCGGTNARITGRAFPWLHGQSAPAGWRVASVPSGASLAYPPGWQLEHSDRGTVSAVLRTSSGRYLGYLNLTPRQGEETLANWATFRVGHNADEGDRGVRRLAAASGLRFLSGRGSCVRDAYTTQIGAQFVEIACLIAGHRDAVVIVAAAPPQAWSQESATLERAIDAART